jgi:GNAT superfamily N-acetyltransferase
MLDTRLEHILEDQRVLMRPLQATDYEHLLYFSESQPQIWAYSLISAASPEQLRHYIDHALAQREAQTQYPLLGYTWYGEEFQGSGINKHCKHLLLRFAFEVCGFERIEFRADAANRRSIQAMLKIGCTFEGVLRNHIPTPQGSRRDTAMLSIIKTDWFENKLFSSFDHLVTSATAADFDEITSLWEASVRATHDFLTEADIQYFKPLVRNQYLAAVQLFCLRDETGITGFLGLTHDNIEMLFVRPDCFGKGVGTKLLRFAVNGNRIRKVDVNEQNPKALRFYQRMGFVIARRSPLDAMGKPYPILHLEIPENNAQAVYY